MTTDTVAGIIRRNSEDRPDKVALRLGERELTFSELDDRSSQLANALLADGVGAADRVAFLDKNAIEHFEVLFGAAKINAVSVDVNWRLAPPEVAFIVNDAEAKVFVVGQEFVPVLDAIADELTTVKRIVVVGGHPHHDDYEDWLAPQPATDPGVESAPDDVATQLYSSGTTGNPKGVMLTNANLFSLLPNGRTVWRLHPDAVNLVAMPLYHIGGGGWALAGMYPGGTTILMREVDPAAIGRALAEQGVTHAFLVPAVIQFMLTVPGIHEGDYSGLQLLLYGASPISEQVLIDGLNTFGPVFMQAYGLTETTGQVVSLPPEDHFTEGPKARLLRSAGRPDPGVEIRIAGADGESEAPVGTVGEILVRSPQNMKGYWNRPEDTAKAFTSEGWLRTGDAGYVDDEGYLYVHDRVKDMIVSGGENIYPAEIENALMAHDAVADVAVIGVPDERWGETPMALVVRVSGVDVTEQELIDHCRSRLAGYKCPRTVTWIDVLPRNPSGKVLKKDLRAPYWEGRTRLVQ
jgi:long-chain acyl-CoA synthetase